MRKNRKSREEGKEEEGQEKVEEGVKGRSNGLEMHSLSKQYYKPMTACIFVASRTFLVASRKAVAEHPLAVERSTVLCSSCPYHHLFTTSAGCWKPYRS